MTRGLRGAAVRAHTKMSGEAYTQWFASMSVTWTPPVFGMVVATSIGRG